jgi:hypothetical protein
LLSFFLVLLLLLPLCFRMWILLRPPILPRA